MTIPDTPRLRFVERNLIHLQNGFSGKPMDKGGGMKKVDSTSRLIGVGIYTPAEAALYTGIPAKDIRR
jgi:hypothetical protein